MPNETGCLDQINQMPLDKSNHHYNYASGTDKGSKRLKLSILSAESQKGAIAAQSLWH